MQYKLGYWIARDKKTNKTLVCRIHKQTTTLFKDPNYFHVVEFVGTAGSLFVDKLLETHDLIKHLDITELTKEL
jgi:hypothetical protein